jgi:hypothetical protein
MQRSLISFRSLDDTNARADWGWNPEFGLSEMTAGMDYDNLKPDNS